MVWLNKIKWILGVLLVFFLILATNLIDRDNFKIISNNTTAIYEDRIVANDLIFELSLLIHEKEIAILSSNTSFFNDRNKEVNKEIDKLIEVYLTTKFTNKEAEVFARLETGLSKAVQIENSEDKDLKSYNRELTNIKDNLYKLSKIQLTEGRNQMLSSKNAFEGVELFTQIEIYLLIFIAIVLQVIILYSPKSKSK